MHRECTFCNILTTDQKTQLATSTYKLKKDKKANKKNSSNNSSTFIDPDHVSVLGAVNTKSPEEKVVKEKQKSKKSVPLKSSIDKDLKVLDQK